MLAELRHVGRAAVTEVPRSKRLTPAVRQARVLKTTGAGLAAGDVPSAAPVPPRVATRTGIPSFVDVEHLDDPDVARPVASKVLWLGAAIPANAIKRDMWYPSNDF